MSHEARAELFGDPSSSLVAEAIWAFRENNGDWPLWDEALEAIARLRESDDADAEAHLLTAIADCEAQACLRLGGRAWGVRLDEQAAARVARRYMDVRMPRRDREETL